MGHSGRPGRSKEKPLENLMFKLKKLPIYQDIGNLFKLSLNFWRTFYLENKSWDWTFLELLTMRTGVSSIFGEGGVVFDF